MAGMPGMSRAAGVPVKSSSAGASIDTSGSMDMSGMAGLGVTDPNWVYTGPALPAAQVSLLTAVGNATDAGHAMQTPNCTTPPTAAQTLGAVQYVQATTAAVAKYQVLSAAVAAGYFPITSTAYPVVHYINPSYMSDQYAMDPNHVDSLVYAFTPRARAGRCYAPDAARRRSRPDAIRLPRPMARSHKSVHITDDPPDLRLGSLPTRDGGQSADADDDPRLAGSGGGRSPRDGPLRPSSGRSGDHGATAGAGSCHRARRQSELEPTRLNRLG